MKKSPFPCEIVAAALANSSNPALVSCLAINFSLLLFGIALLPCALYYGSFFRFLLGFLLGLRLDFFFFFRLSVILELADY
jgi:hypothetical protein